MMTIEPARFAHDGITLVGTWYRPHRSSPDGGTPAVIAAPGFGGVKEMGFPAIAGAIAEAGIATLVFDYAGFGASGGEPREHVDPEQQLAQFGSALSYAAGLEWVDARRLGVCGPSLGGARALRVAATDQRVRCAVAIAPYVEQAGDAPPEVIEAVIADAVARADGAPHRTIPIVGHPGDLAVLTSDGAWDWVQRELEKVPDTPNEVTLASLIGVSEYRPLDGITRFPVPVLVIIATDDTINLAATTLRALDGIGGVDLVEIPATHFSIFDEHLPDMAAATVEWFARHLDTAPR